MGRILSLHGPRLLVVEEAEDPPLEPDQVRVRTLWSGISAGTELAAYRGTTPFARKAWDPARRIFGPRGADSTGFPIRDLGYEEVGEVVEVGRNAASVAPRLEEGAIVYGAWGHRTHAVLSAEYARDRILPAGADPILGIWSHIGPIALNGVFDAQARIGETIAVFGVGVVGQAVAQLLARSGVLVVAVDLLPERLDLAQSLGGIDLAIRGDLEDAAARIRELTEGRGADAAIEVAGIPAALHEAVRATAYGGRVVVMGFHQGEARGLYLGEEFHHNRIVVVSSQISGVAPELSRRWDRRRLVDAFMRLQIEGAVDLRPLVSHRFPFERAGEAFDLLHRSPEDALQVVLEFPATSTGATADVDAARAGGG